jgi:hypothetical protein
MVSGVVVQGSRLVVPPVPELPPALDAPPIEESRPPVPPVA